MGTQKLGKIIFWIGVIYVMVANWLLSWFVTPYTKNYSPAELSNTVWATDGFLFWFWVLAGPIGATIALTGLLIYSQKKWSSMTWLLGPVAIIAHLFIIAPYSPTQHYPVLYGIGGGIIAVSFLGIFWAWGKTHAMLEGFAKIGAYFQLFGYFFLMMASYALCGHFSGPHLAAFEYKPVNTPESVLIALAIGWLFLFIGHFLIARVKK